MTPPWPRRINGDGAHTKRRKNPDFLLIHKRSTMGGAPAGADDPKRKPSRK
jgi:hypothetical protein